MNDQLHRNIGIYSPYLSIMGGGERYLLTIAQVLSHHHEVTVFGSAQQKHRAQTLFNLSLETVRFLPNHPLREQQFWKKYPRLRAYDIFIYMTDGSLFFPMSKKNLLLIQSPDHIPPKTIFNHVKKYGWKPVCYSAFMRDIIHARTGQNAVMLPPAIDTGVFTAPAEKSEKYILTVGRFFPYPHNKKQDILIKAFVQAYTTYFSGWRLVVTGGLTEHGGEEIVRRLQHLATGFPVEILINVPFSQLQTLYRQATIYWHAAGFGEDLAQYPQRAEHFGITTLEAMASGAVPVVFAGGGQQDIVQDGRSGYLWRTTDELVKKTATLIASKSEFAHLQRGALERVQDFSLDIFRERLQKLIM